MQKEIDSDKNSILYTILFECYSTNESFLDQIFIKESSLENALENVLELASLKIINNSIDIAKRLRSLSTEEKVFEEELNKEVYDFSLIDNLVNTWSKELSLANIFYSLSVIKTCSRPVSNINKQKLSFTQDPRFIDVKKQIYYKSEYLSLKNVTTHNKTINRERNKIERYMNYWDIKNRFLRNLPSPDNLNSSSNLYTVIFEYEGGTYINQLKVSDYNFQFLLMEWAKQILEEKSDSNGKKIINKERDRLMLMEKVVNPIYQLQPLSTFVNVWSTYLSLSEGVGDIIVIKTDTTIDDCL